ncbi:MAG: 4a-hydroxytetrahydrobiopterin dehydratase [Rhodothermia bacterium]|nr:4a-hydroxytetrahydrobiopterin dehydratase [Rhodothermia bacterium]NNL48720.1 4a-hydroxytetrahydrobiopterin dehydratase [Acidimicrobiia bacterium]
MSKPLTDEQINEALGRLKGWSLQDDKLVKTFTFSTFPEAISFIVRLAFEAEQVEHHPEIQNVYNRVEVSLTTHDAGNRVTGHDVNLAQTIQSFVWV